jgi:hypothetical protein
MHRHTNWVWLAAFAAGCAVATVPPMPVEGEMAASTAHAIIRLRRETLPEPGPKPDGECCSQCENGWITHGDGHRTPCPCPPTCRCKRAGGDDE